MSFRVGYHLIVFWRSELMVPLITSLTICTISNSPNLFSESGTDKYLTKRSNDDDSLKKPLLHPINLNPTKFLI